MAKKKPARFSAARILVINPGSTSTKIAMFKGKKRIFEKTVAHSHRQLATFSRIVDQLDFRRQAIQKTLDDNGADAMDIDAVAARGGLTKPIPGGVYGVNRKMIEDLLSGEYGEHPSCLGAPIGDRIARDAGVPCYIVDPPIVDERWEPARYSGHPIIERRSIFHALSQRAAARRAAADLGCRYESCNFIVVHMGGGVSIGAHRKGRVVDVNDALEGEGPFSPERTGGLPALGLARLCFSGGYSFQDIRTLISRNGGLAAYLGTNDCREIETRITDGDKTAKAAYEAMAYQIAKAVGEMAVVLSGKVTAVVLTGGLAASKMMIRMIRKYARFIAPFKVYPGMEEMSALAAGASAALNGEITIRRYH